MQRTPDGRRMIARPDEADVPSVDERVEERARLGGVVGGAGDDLHQHVALVADAQDGECEVGQLVDRERREAAEVLVVVAPAEVARKHAQ
eukprot:4064527-Heterocapsa_arctica.AAC.1